MKHLFADERYQRLDVPSGQQQPVCMAALNDFISTAENTRTSIRKTCYAGRMELDMAAIPEDQRIAIVQYLVHESAAPATGGC